MPFPSLRGATCAVATCAAAAVLAVGTHAVHAGTVVYVDDDGPVGGDGVSWVTAYRFLQDALAFAASPDNGVGDIRVGQGLYVPNVPPSTSPPPTQTVAPLPPTRAVPTEPSTSDALSASPHLPAMPAVAEIYLSC